MKHGILLSYRYGLNNSKHKSDQFLQRKPFFHTTHWLAHLLSSEYDRNSKNAAANKVPLSMCSIDRRVPKTRTLTFVRQCHSYEGKEVFLLSFNLFSIPYEVL